MKILIFTKNWLGDLLFQYPAIEIIRETYPSAEIFCAAPARCRGMLEAHPAVNKVLVFDEKKEHRSWWKRVQFAFQLRKEGCDQVYLFHRSRTRAFLTFLAGIPERFGYANRGESRFLTKAVAEPQEPLHQVNYFLYLVSQCGLPGAGERKYRFYFSSKAEVAAKRLLEKYQLSEKQFLCFHLGANWAPKRWPISHFAELADNLHDKWHLPVAVTGAPEDLELFRDLHRRTKKARIVSLIGQTTLEELGAVFSFSLAVISGDSGPMHIASGSGASVLALFGPTDPALTGPRGTGETAVLRHVPAGLSVPWYGEFPEGGWLEHIRPEEVLEEIERRGWLQKRIPAMTAVNNPKIGFSEPAQKDILVITLSNIGDVIITTPVLMALLSLFPGARLSVVVSPRAEGVLKGSHFIDRLLIYDKRSGLKEKIKLIRELRKRRYECVVDLKNSAIPFLVSAKKRSPIVRLHKSVSLRERHLEVLQMMKLFPATIPYFDFYHRQDEESMMKKIRLNGISDDRGWILVAPAAANRLKTWPLEKYKQVIEKLLSVSPAPVFVVGSGAEADQVRPLVDLDPKRVYNLAGQTNLRELAVLVSRCRLLLANDSSLMHLGNELRVKVVGVFGPTHYRKMNYPKTRFQIVREEMPCAPCEESRCRFDRQHCFEDLSAQKVFEACQKFLDAHD